GNHPSPGVLLPAVKKTIIFSTASFTCSFLLELKLFKERSKEGLNSNRIGIKIFSSISSRHQACQTIFLFV
ncbi:MAG: hypothetical protein M1421_05965, partial [Candidatus Eremiobacteraeota bacterium]|nr:hypothetical protein [Candidatus Eremiobacteraeota bacterium]